MGGREDRNLPCGNVRFRNHAAHPAEMICMAMTIDHGRNGPRAELRIDQRQRGGCGFAAGERIDQNPAGGPANHGHVRNIEPAHLPHAFGHFEQPVPPQQAHFAPQRRVDAGGGPRPASSRSLACSTRFCRWHRGSADRRRWPRTRAQQTPHRGHPPSAALPLRPAAPPSWPRSAVWAQVLGTAVVCACAGAATQTSMAASASRLARLRTIGGIFILSRHSYAPSLSAWALPDKRKLSSNRGAHHPGWSVTPFTTHPPPWALARCRASSAARRASRGSPSTAIWATPQAMPGARSSTANSW